MRPEDLLEVPVRHADGGSQPAQGVLGGRGGGLPKGGQDEGEEARAHPQLQEQLHRVRSDLLHEISGLLPPGTDPGVHRDQRKVRIAPIKAGLVWLLVGVVRRTEGVIYPYQNN